MNLSLPAYGVQRSTACVWALSALSGTTRGVVLSLASAHAVIAARFSNGPNLARLSVPFHHNRNWKIKILQPYDVSVLSCSLEALVGWFGRQELCRAGLIKSFYNFNHGWHVLNGTGTLCVPVPRQRVFIFSTSMHLVEQPGFALEFDWLSIVSFLVMPSASPARFGQKQNKLQKHYEKNTYSLSWRANKECRHDGFRRLQGCFFGTLSCTKRFTTPALTEQKPQNRKSTRYSLHTLKHFY